MIADADTKPQIWQSCEDHLASGLTRLTTSIEWADGRRQLVDRVAINLAKIEPSVLRERIDQGVEKARRVLGVGASNL